jgi:hypothetical protein
VSTPKPKLVAVETPSAEDVSAQPPEKPSRFGHRIQFGLLIVLVAAAAAVAVLQAQRADLLAAQVQTLEVELGAAQATLGRYEYRFGEIQASVGGLRVQLGELEALVQVPPQTPAP